MIAPSLIWTITRSAVVAALCLVVFGACSETDESPAEASAETQDDVTANDTGGSPTDTDSADVTAPEETVASPDGVTSDIDEPDGPSAGDIGGEDVPESDPPLSPTEDQDGDGLEDASDNCPALPNPIQRDLNGNGVGDLCDPDEPTTGVAFYGRYTLPCEEDGCPVDRNIDLFRVDFDLADGTTTHTQLTENSDGVKGSSASPSPDDDTPVALSQDRQWLYFHNALTGTQDVRRVATDGSESPALLSPSGTKSRFIHASGDGGTVYFLSDLDGDDDLYQASAKDGSGLVNLSNNLETDESVLAVLPGDAGVVVMLGKEGNDPDNTGADGEIHVLHFDDGVWTQLTDDRVWNRFQAISADGALVAYRRPIDEDNDGQQDPGSGEIWVVRTDGSAPPTRLRSFIEGHLGDTFRITHDHEYVLYDFKEEGSSIRQIYAVEVGGDNPVTQLTNPLSGESSYYRMLSGDAKTVLYTTNDETDGFGDVEVYATPTSGGPSVLVSDIANDAIVLPRGVLDAQGAVVVEGNFDGGDLDLYVGAPGRR